MSARSDGSDLASKRRMRMRLRARRIRVAVAGAAASLFVAVLLYLSAQLAYTPSGSLGGARTVATVVSNGGRKVITTRTSTGAVVRETVPAAGTEGSTAERQRSGASGEGTAFVSTRSS